jgi:hypothetical protein
MLKNAEFFEAWERDWIRSHPVDFSANLRLFEAMYLEACHFGVLPPKDPLEGLDLKINLAKALNVRKTS